MSEKNDEPVGLQLINALLQKADLPIAQVTHNKPFMFYSNGAVLVGTITGLECTAHRELIVTVSNSHFAGNTLLYLIFDDSGWRVKIKKDTYIEYVLLPGSFNLL